LSTNYLEAGAAALVDGHAHVTLRGGSDLNDSAHLPT
jgi:hypothetical protein